MGKHKKSGYFGRLCDLIECATINDLILGKGQVTPENFGLTRQKDFSYRLVSRSIKKRKNNGNVASR
jgi:hypothetical protein